jgi:hypothetical protein
VAAGELIDSLSPVVPRQMMTTAGAAHRGPRPLELVDSSPPFTGEVLCRDGRSELLLKAQMESSGHRGGIGFNRTPIQSMLSSELTGIRALY